MERARIFKSNQSQAVRLPKAVALADHVRQVDVIVQGDGRLLVPSGSGWASWFDAAGPSPDFMMQREQPTDQEREGF